MLARDMSQGQRPDSFLRRACHLTWSTTSTSRAVGHQICIYIYLHFPDEAVRKSVEQFGRLCNYVN